MQRPQVKKGLGILNTLKQHGVSWNMLSKWEKNLSLGKYPEARLDWDLPATVICSCFSLSIKQAFEEFWL